MTTSETWLERAWLTEDTKRNVGVFGVVGVGVSTELKTWVYSLIQMASTLQTKPWQCLNKQFMSVFTSDDGKHLPDKGPSRYREMDTIQFTQPGIEMLQQQKLTKRKVLAQMSYQQGYWRRLLKQHGFRKGLSCETHIVDTIHELA